MKIRVLGGGWYGCHLTRALLRGGHDVELHEIRPDIFMGASGNQPARLHLGFHYPRSRLTRAACQDHYQRFMHEYGHLTSGVRTNIYAIASQLSLVDFGNYVQTLKEEVEFVKIEKPAEFGLRHVEGALLTGERHVVIARARDFFRRELASVLRFDVPPDRYAESDFDFTVDATFCARDSRNVDRYEPCITGILEGPMDRAVTIMDGPFPSLYPWDEERGLNSLTSAKHTPLTKNCHSYEEAMRILKHTPREQKMAVCETMVDQIFHYYPQIRDGYQLVDYREAVRAMPLSGADARLVDMVRTSPTSVRIRASKLDAIFYAEDLVREAIQCL